jgi:hypothetical protein
MLAIFGIFLAFITFNLENRCDISFGFTIAKEVPVFLTIFISFALGLFCALPFVIRAGKARKVLKEKEKKPVKEEKECISDGTNSPAGGFHGDK